MISRRNSLFSCLYEQNITNLRVPENSPRSRRLKVRESTSLSYDVNENTRSLSLTVSEDVFVTLTMSRRN